MNSTSGSVIPTQKNPVREKRRKKVSYRGVDPLPRERVEKVPTHSMLVGYLAWIFGIVGLHRFYFGKPISGCLWALTGGLLGIGWLVDIFLVPAMNTEANRRFTPGRYDYSVAAILHFFVGMFGIHRFYLGKIGTGIIFLLTGGLLGIGYIYDLLTLNGQIDELNIFRRS